LNQQKKKRKHKNDYHKEEDDSKGEESDREEAWKEESVSLEESWIHVLALVRGISEDKAAVISRAFPSLRTLLDHYEELEKSKGSEAASMALAELRCNNRKIGTVLSKRVHRMMYLSKPHSLVQM